MSSLYKDSEFSTETYPTYNFCRGCRKDIQDGTKSDFAAKSSLTSAATNKLLPSEPLSSFSATEALKNLDLGASRQVSAMTTDVSNCAVVNPFPVYGTVETLNGANTLSSEPNYSQHYSAEDAFSISSRASYENDLLKGTSLSSSGAPSAKTLSENAAVKTAAIRRGSVDSYESSSLSKASMPAADFDAGIGKKDTPLNDLGALKAPIIKSQDGEDYDGYQMNRFESRSIADSIKSTGTFSVSRPQEKTSSMGAGFTATSNVSAAAGGMYAGMQTASSSVGLNPYAASPYSSSSQPQSSMMNSPYQTTAMPPLAGYEMPSSVASPYQNMPPASTLYSPPTSSPYALPPSASSQYAAAPSIITKSAIFKNFPESIRPTLTSTAERMLQARFEGSQPASHPPLYDNSPYGAYRPVASQAAPNAYSPYNAPQPSSSPYASNPGVGAPQSFYAQQQPQQPPMGANTPYSSYPPQNVPPPFGVVPSSFHGPTGGNISNTPPNLYQMPPPPPPSNMSDGGSRNSRPPY